MKPTQMLVDALSDLVDLLEKSLKSIELHGKLYDVHGDEVSLMLYSKALGESAGLDIAITKIRRVLKALDGEV